MDDLVDRIARALVPLLCGSQEDQHGRDLPDKQYDDLPPDWQDAHRRYAQATIDASGITRLTAERDAALAELRQLTGSIWKAEYRKTAPDWQPLPDLVGLITQLDNMYAGVREQRDAAREALWKIERNEDATYSRALARAALASWQERG